MTGVGAGLLLVGSLTACSDDQAPLCASIDDLQASVDGLQEIDVGSSDAVSELGTGLSAVSDDLTTVKNDAESEFSTPIDTVESSYAQLETTVQDAQNDPTATTLGAAGSALSQFASDVDALVSDVQSTC